LVSRVLIFTKGKDRLSHLFSVNLGCQINGDDDGVTVERQGCLLIVNHNQSCGVGGDLVPGDVDTFHDRHAFQIGGHLFQRISFGGFRCQAHGIFLRIAGTHPICTLGQDDSRLGVCDLTEAPLKDWGEKKRENEQQRAALYARKIQAARRVGHGRHP
jgi:hypothetical protein